MVATNQQVRRLHRLDQEGLPPGLVAAKAREDPKTARKYRWLGELPSEAVMEHAWRIRPDVSADVWPALEVQLRVATGLEAKMLFRELHRHFPGRFSDGQLRTLQHRIKSGGDGGSVHVAGGAL